MAGRSHHNWVRWPKTTPMRLTWPMRSCQGTRPWTSQRPESGTTMPERILTVVRFARPVWPDIADQFAGFQRERDAVQRPNGAVRALYNAPEGTPKAGAALGNAVGFD